MTKTEVMKKAGQLRIKYGKLCGGMYLVIHDSRDRFVRREPLLHEEWYELFQIGPRGGIHDLGIRVNKIISPDVRIIEDDVFYPECIRYFYYNDYHSSLPDPKDCMFKPCYILAAMENIPYEFTDDAKELRKKEEEKRKKEEEKIAKTIAEEERKMREHLEREERKWREREERERREREQRRKRRNYKHREQERPKSQKHSELTQNMGELMKKAGIIS